MHELGIVVKVLDQVDELAAQYEAEKILKVTMEVGEVSTIVPELQVYTSFESPNWRCRVGDFVTRQEANDYLNKLKEARLGQGAIIVKSEVYIHQ